MQELAWLIHQLLGKHGCEWCPTTNEEASLDCGGNGRMPCKEISLVIQSGYAMTPPISSPNMHSMHHTALYNKIWDIFVWVQFWIWYKYLGLFSNSVCDAVWKGAQILIIKSHLRSSTIVQIALFFRPLSTNTQDTFLKKIFNIKSHLKSSTGA